MRYASAKVAKAAGRPLLGTLRTRTGKSRKIEGNDHCKQVIVGAEHSD